MNRSESEAKQLMSLIDWKTADLGDMPSLDRALSGVQQVFHCAGKIGFHRRQRSKLMQTNAVGTANLVNACLAAEVKKFCHVSSIAALGMKSDNEVVD
jgi:dihydroflavonol-4-reductase